MINCIDIADKSVINILRSVSTSSRTIAKRIEHLGNYLKGKLRKIINNCTFFSLALDETTDVTDKSQLIICVRAIYSNYVINEEIFSLISLTETSKGIDIFHAFIKSINENGADIKKLAAICTDGAPSMVGKVNLKGSF